LSRVRLTIDDRSDNIREREVLDTPQRDSGNSRKVAPANPCCTRWSSTRQPAKVACMIMARRSLGELSVPLSLPTLHSCRQTLNNLHRIRRRQRPNHRARTRTNAHDVAHLSPFLHARSTASPLRRREAPDSKHQKHHNGPFLLPGHTCGIGPQTPLFTPLSQLPDRSVTQRKATRLCMPMRIMLQGRDFSYPPARVYHDSPPSRQDY